MKKKPNPLTCIIISQTNKWKICTNLFIIDFDSDSYQMDNIIGDNK